MAKTVVVRDGKVDNAIRTLKQVQAKDGTIKKLKDRQHYTKRGVKQRLAKKEGIKNTRRRERRYN